MREIFLTYAKRGTMTKEELAKVLNVSAGTVRRMAADGRIERVPGLRFLRFDPLKMIDVFCAAKAESARSLTIERHKTGAKPNGGYRKCL